ncbi:MAG: DUF4397 domain-containing protein [Saprospiraceae bacterium]|nr:DUF4397 domain-containing protein [Saprospiraceae bacterium]
MAFFHGMTDAPAGDIDILWVANNVVQGLSYGEFSNYISLSPDVYHLSLRAAGSPVSSGLRRADFSTLKGKSAHLFFSGLINGNSDWGLYAALADGTVIEIPQESTTRVQFIQNSPGAPVDIYAGATKWLDDFTFRTATPFIDVPADQSINIGVAPANSTSSAAAFANFQTTFSSGKKYTVYASGVKGSPARPFVLQAFDDAQETSLLGQVSVSAMHGSPDAPAVDVAERTLGLLFSDLSYGEQSAYTDVPGTVLFLDLKLAGQDQILQTYMADLSGLSGQALRIFASGYLSNGIPPFGLFAALPDGTVTELPVFPVARVQFLNNSPTEARDIYTFDDLAFDDFAFRTATGYTYVPAGFPIPFGVAPSGSASVSDAIYTQNISFANGGTYVVVLSGQNGNAQAPLSFIVKGNAHESAVSPDALEIAVVHGVPDMPTINLASVLDGSNFLSDLHYGQISNYVSVGDPGFELLDVLNAADLRKVYGIYGGDFTGTGGISLVLFASGLLDAPDDEGKFGLFLMLPDGIVLPMPSFARAQLIHNAPDAPIDLWYSDEFTPDGVLVAENVEFRSATGFGFYPAAGAFDLSVAPAGSTSINQAVYTQSFFLDTQKEYTFMATGVVGNAATPFQFYVDENARRFAENVNQVDVNFFHGAPCAQGLNVDFIGNILFDNVAYGQFEPYQNVPPSTYLVELSVAGTGNPIGRYEAALGALTGQALTVFASGYLNQSPGLELWAAELDGSTYPLPIISATNDVLETIQHLSLAPNPASDEMVVSFEMKNTSAVRFQVLDMTGRNIMEGDWGELGGNTAQRIPVAHLPNGIYQLQVMIPEGSLSARFAVQR